MPDHLLSWLEGLLIGCAATVGVAVATRVRLLPEVIGISLIPTGAGVGSLVLAGYGAARRFPPDRLGRLTLLGTLLGGGITAVVLGFLLAAQILW